MASKTVIRPVVVSYSLRLLVAFIFAAVVVSFHRGEFAEIPIGKDEALTVCKRSNSFKRYCILPLMKLLLNLKIPLAFALSKNIGITYLTKI